MQLPRCPNLWLLTPLLLAAFPASSADLLTPLSTASQRQVAPARSSVPQVDQRKLYYEKFEREMRQMRSAEQRSALRAEFQRKLDTSGTADEKNHYRQLLGILKKFPDQEQVAR